MKKKPGPFDPDFAEAGDYPPGPIPKGPIVLIGFALIVGIALMFWLVGSTSVVLQPPTQAEPTIEAQDADPRAAPAPLLDPDPFAAPR